MIDIKNIISNIYIQFNRAGLSIPEIDICSRVLTDKRFTDYPASTSKHHTFIHGLAEHTNQVMRLALNISDEFDIKKKVDKKTICLASFFHDSGKMFDYEPCDMSKENPLGFRKTNHNKKIYHVPKSYAIFCEHFGSVLSEQMVEDVGHCILSHHGRLEWGSPVLPCTKEAWIVHLADCLSVHAIDDRKG